MISSAEAGPSPIRTDLDADVGALDPTAAGFNRFRFRAAHPAPRSTSPSRRVKGPLRLRLRALARVRTAVAFHVAGTPGAEVIVPKAPWGDYEVDLPAADDGGGLEAVLALRPLPMVRVPDEYMARPMVWMADIEASAPGGLVFSPARACCWPRSRWPSSRSRSRSGPVGRGRARWPSPPRWPLLAGSRSRAARPPRRC